MFQISRTDYIQESGRKENRTIYVDKLETAMDAYRHAKEQGAKPVELSLVLKSTLGTLSVAQRISAIIMLLSMKGLDQ